MKYDIPICDYLNRRDDNDVLVDIREPLLFRFGTVPGAVNIPVDKLDQLYCLPKEKPIYVFCQSGEASEEIAELLRNIGYTAYNLTGGYRDYLREHL